jgi:phosphatidylglycerol lysyltransferase
MGTSKTVVFFRDLYKGRSVPFIRENSKLIGQFVLTALFFGLGIWFLKHERAELTDVKSTLRAAHWVWLLTGIAVSALYLVLQGLMYVYAFSSIQCKVDLKDTIALFLKRNLISVFLPAGGVSSLAFFTGPLERKGITKAQIHYASSIYGFIGILTVILVAVPAFIFSLAEGNSGAGEWLALTALLMVTGSLLYLYRLLLKKGHFYRWLLNHFPDIEFLIEDIRNNKVNSARFILAVMVSLAIELTGVAHVYIAMKALHIDPSLFAALMAYIVSVIFLIVSPFLRGLGAIEVSMSIILVRFGFSNVEAISATLLYRFFEFWLPLFSGVISFLSGIRSILMRVIPAFMLLLLGIINIVSVLTPAISWRMERLQEYIMMDAIDASNYFVLAAGLFLLVTAAFMLKGLRSAWWLAMLLSVVSAIGHITKAIDYEEASVAIILVVVLLFTRKEYYVRNNPRMRFVGWQVALFSIAAILVYGIIGFYLLDKKHFNTEFSLIQSVRQTILNYFLVGSHDLVPRDNFSQNFLYSLNAGGFLSLAFLLYTLMKPFIYKGNASPEELSKARDLLNRYARSGLDYFKTYQDKMIFCQEGTEGFISYRVSGNFAVVLENPVARDEETLLKCISLFDTYCYENGLKTIYYRAPEESLPLYARKGKKHMFIGQEAVLDLGTFTMEGGSRKSLRNAINRIKDRGYTCHIHQPPIRDGLLQKLKSVSDEWLSHNERQEIVFSQGMFIWEDLKQQTILTAENAEEKVVAFLNIIPDYAPGEATYDLFRKTADAPNGIMDYMLIEFFGYLRSQQFRYVNLGFAPMSGMQDAHTFKEKSMKFAYERIRSFSHYKGLREFKEKYDPVWYNKYLIYDQDYDLLQVPVVLTKVIKP